MVAMQVPTRRAARRRVFAKGEPMPDMISLEEARALVLSQVEALPVETVSILDAVGRVAAADLRSDIDISPFAHSAMDGFAVRADDLAAASEDAAVELDVIAEVAAGETYDGPMASGQCVRIMTCLLYTSRCV